MARVFKAFRFDPQIYADFKELASKSGYTMTAALEKFMADAVKFGLVFPSSQNAAVEAEARVMLAWLREGKYWVSLGGKEETSTRGRLLQLLSKVENAELRVEIEENLKKKGSVKHEHRRTFKAYDGINNLFNLGYEVLNWKVRKALVNAKLEPFLCYLHGERFGKPSLVCDFMEIYRYMIDDFIIGFCKELTRKDFITKNEVMLRGKVGKREYLNDAETKDFMVKLDKLFSGYVERPRIRHGKRQEFDTLTSEEALLFAKHLRNERKEWNPRLISLTF